MKTYANGIVLTRDKRGNYVTPDGGIRVRPLGGHVWSVDVKHAEGVYEVVRVVTGFHRARAKAAEVLDRILKEG